MDYIKSKNSEKELLTRLSGFSKNMIKHHQLENLSEFVVHDLCSQDLFNINKAAYLVNNPDFSCLKGVAGYHQPESFKHDNNWQSHKAFTSHMKSSDFNQKVRSVNDRALIVDQSKLDSGLVYDVAQRLEMRDPIFHIWNMRYDNQGIFIFEKPEESGLVEDHLLNFLHVLSFCAVF